MDTWTFVILVILSTLDLARRADGFNARPCGPGWTPNRTGCYKFVSNKLVTKEGAREECHNYGATLLRITTQDQMDWFKNAVSQHPSSGYWSDMYRTPDGTWLWDYSVPANMSLITWNTSPANDRQSTCAGINVDGKLTDLDCNTYQGYICSYESSYCPLDWLIGANNRCYFVSNTSDPTQLVTREEAKNICGAKQITSGSALLDYTDTSTANFIQSELPYLSVNPRAYWIDLTYQVNGWFSSKGVPLPPELSSWAGPEPDNVAGMENRAVVRMSGRFSDRSCTSTANFVCEAPQDKYMEDLGCGKHWLRADRHCFGFFSSDQPVSWAEARRNCQLQAADLLKLDSLNTKIWLYDQLKKPVNNRVFWTGLNDQKQERSYTWADGSSVDTGLVSWNQGSSDLKGDEPCAVMYETGQNNAVSCSSLAAAICEMKALESGCLPNWRRHLDKCYLFTSYANNSMLYTHEEAVSHCSHLMDRRGDSPKQADLLSVSTVDEQSILKQWLSAMPVENVHGWYTSLNNRDFGGVWSYGDGTSDIDLINWNGEPSSKLGDNCGILNGSGDFLMRQCDLRLHLYICQKSFTPKWLKNDGEQSSNDQNHNGSNDQNGSKEQNGSNAN